MSTLSWQAGTASGPFLVGTLIQALIQVNDVNYVWENWHGTLLVIAITFLVFASNVWGARAMPMAQNLMLVIHVFGFISIVVVFWVLAPHNSARTVFTVFTNSGGWNSMGLALMVGQISAIYACICTFHVTPFIEASIVTRGRMTDTTQVPMRLPIWQKRSRTLV